MKSATWTQRWENHFLLVKSPQLPLANTPCHVAETPACTTSLGQYWWLRIQAFGQTAWFLLDRSCACTTDTLDDSSVCMEESQVIYSCPELQVVELDLSPHLLGKHPMRFLWPLTDILSDAASLCEQHGSCRCHHVFPGQCAGPWDRIWDSEWMNTYPSSSVSGPVLGAGNSLASETNPPLPPIIQVIKS